MDDHAAGFQILDKGRRQGSIIYDFAVAISASGIWDLMKAYYGFDSFLAQSYVAYRAGRLFDEPPYSRTQLSLAAPGGNSTLLDASYVYDRRRLLQRTRLAMSAITAPLGITASVVEVSIDGNHLDNITSRLASGENIDEWLQAYRAAHGRPAALM